MSPVFHALNTEEMRPLCGANPRPMLVTLVENHVNCDECNALLDRKALVEAVKMVRSMADRVRTEINDNGTDARDMANRLVTAQSIFGMQELNFLLIGAVMALAEISDAVILGEKPNANPWTKSKHAPSELCDCPNPKANGRPYHCATAVINAS